MPIPATRAALGRLDLIEGGDLLVDLTAVAARLDSIVPAVVGLSLTLTEWDITLTYVPDAPSTPEPGLATETAPETAPETEGSVGRQPGPPQNVPLPQKDARSRHEAGGLPDDLELMLVEAAKDYGVRSSLALDVMVDEHASATVQLYSADADAFDEVLTARLSELFGCAAGLGLRDTDLGFGSRLDALAAPRRLSQLKTVDDALVALRDRHGLDTDGARRRLQASADRAGVSLLDMARLVLTLPRRP